MNKEDFYEWKNHPVTKEVHKGVKEAIEAIDSQLHGITGANAEEIAMTYQRLVGIRQGLVLGIEVSFDEEEEEVE